MKINYTKTVLLGFLGCAIAASLPVQAGNHTGRNDNKTGKVNTRSRVGLSALVNSFVKPGDDETTALYAKIYNFNASCDNKKITLSWTTSSEGSNEYFIVEKSADGKQWYTLAMVKGLGGVGEANNYSVNDYPDENSDGIYYRLNLKVERHTTYLKIVTGSKNRP